MIVLFACFVLWSPEPDGFNLADALDDQNDLDDRKKPSVGEGGGKT